MIKRFKRFSLELSDPVKVYQGEAGDVKWGHYQFPALYPTRSGSILAEWGYHDDTVERTGFSKNAVTKAVTDDGGKTWRPKTDADAKAFRTVMSNGKAFIGFDYTAGFKADFLENYTPQGSNYTGHVYFVEDLKELEKPTFTASEYDPITGEVTRFPATVNWPYMPVGASKTGVITPVDYEMAIQCYKGILVLDDGMYYCMYSRGFDSDAPTKEQAVHKYCGEHNVYLFKSTDCGRTWNYLSRQLVTDEVHTGSNVFEGYNEPGMSLMPDGSVVMLMRTGGGWVNDHGSPCYLVRSTDRCKTWSKPVKFDEVGVMPQIRTLKCGVSIATYGRPGLYLRVTDDPSGQKWEERIEIPLAEGKEWRSCYYTDLYQLDDTSFLMIYTDFHQPLDDGSGEEGKAIMVRKITVTMNEE